MLGRCVGRSCVILHAHKPIGQEEQYDDPSGSSTNSFGGSPLPMPPSALGFQMWRSERLAFDTVYRRHQLAIGRSSLTERRSGRYRYHPCQRVKTTGIRLEPKPHEKIPQQVSAALASVRNFDLSLCETKVQVPHKPTQEELKHQAQHDANVKRFPTLYKPGRTIWRSWDDVPSGRLSLELKDASRVRWDNKDLVGRWYDRKTKTLEEYLSDAIPALKEASILAKHRRAEKLERERLKAEREEMLRREKARRDREQKRLEYLTKKASAYDAYCRLERLWEVLRPQLASDSESQANRIIRSLGQRLELDRLQFTASTLEGEVRDFGLFAEGDIGDVL